MDLVELNKQIRTRQLEKFYIFTGKEIGLQHLYLDMISKDCVYIDAVSSIYRTLTSNMMKFAKPKIYVVRDDKEFITSEKAWKDIKDKIKNGTLILLLTDINKTSKFYTAYKNDIIEFNPMTTQQLIPTVSKMIDGSTGALEYFIESCNNDYTTILNNLDKCKRLGYTRMSKSVSDEVAPRKETTNLFDLVDSILSKDRSKAINLATIHFTNDDNPLGFFMFLYKKLKQCILIAGQDYSDDIAKVAGLNNWSWKKLAQTVKLQPSELLTSLRILEKYDSGIKTGIYTPELAFYSSIIEIINL